MSSPMTPLLPRSDPGAGRREPCVSPPHHRSGVSKPDPNGGQVHRDRWTRPVIAAPTEVHRVPGAGLPEPVYRLALVAELRSRGIPPEQNKTVPIRYPRLVLFTAPVI